VAGNTYTRAKSLIDMAAKQVLVVDDFVQPMDLLCNMLRHIGLEDIRQARKPDAARQHCEGCSFNRVC
jgi:hypothetical protein